MTAKGKGYVAEEIIKKATELGIPIQQDKALVGLLSQVELNHEIPEELYEAIVQVLIFAYQITGKEVQTATQSESVKPEKEKQ